MVRSVLILSANVISFNISVVSASDMGACSAEFGECAMGIPGKNPIENGYKSRTIISPFSLKYQHFKINKNILHF